MHKDAKSGNVVILEVTHSSTALKGGTKHRQNYMLATVISAAGNGVVRIAGEPETMARKVQHYGYRCSVICLSQNLQDTAQQVVAAMNEPVEFETIEQCRGHVAQHAPAQSYQAKYDRSGRLVPANPILRDEMTARRKVSQGESGRDCKAITEHTAIAYARWLAMRDLVALDPVWCGRAIWADCQMQGKACERVRAVEFYTRNGPQQTIAIPNWDFDPAPAVETIEPEEPALQLAA